MMECFPSWEGWECWRIRLSEDGTYCHCPVSVKAAQK